MRECKRCGEVKALDAFRPNSQQPKYRLRTCRTCEAEQARASREADPARHRATQERHRRKRGNKPFQPARVLTAEEKRAGWRADYWSNRANRLAYMSGYAKANPERNRERLRLRRALEGKSLSELVVLELDDGVCGICGYDVDPLSYEIDHITPLSRGGEHSYANVQIAHATCNRRKHALLPWDERLDDLRRDAAMAGAA